MFALRKVGLVNGAASRGDEYIHRRDAINMAMRLAENDRLDGRQSKYIVDDVSGEKPKLIFCITVDGTTYLNRTEDVNAIR